MMAADERITFPSPDTSDPVYYYIWSGEMSRRYPAAAINPSIPMSQVRTGTNTTANKYELVSKVLVEGDVIGFEPRRIVNRLVFVAEEDTVLVQIPQSVFETLLKPSIIAQLDKKLTFLRGLPCFRE